MKIKNKYFFNFVFLIIISAIPIIIHAETWVEPNCDPNSTTDWSTCNISAPLNTSSDEQTKSGTLNANALHSNDTITADGNITSDSSLIGDIVRTDNIRPITDGGSIEFHGELYFSSTPGNMGSMIIPVKSSEPTGLTSDDKGYLYFNSTDSTIYLYNGTSFVSIPMGDNWVDTTGDTMTGSLVMNNTGLTLNYNNGTLSGDTLKLDSYPYSISTTNYAAGRITLKDYNSSGSLNDIYIDSYRVSNTSTANYLRVLSSTSASTYMLFNPNNGNLYLYGGSAGLSTRYVQSNASTGQIITLRSQGSVSATGVVTPATVEVTSGGYTSGSTTAYGNMTLYSYGSSTSPAYGNITLTPNNVGRVTVNGSGMMEITKADSSATTSAPLTITNNDTDSNGMYIDQNTDNYGLYVSSTGTSAPAIYGENYTLSPTSSAVSGHSLFGYGVHGISEANIGVYGEAVSGGYGVSAIGTGSAYGLYASAVDGFGIFATTDANIASGLSNRAAIRGSAENAYGLVGESQNYYGVYGISGTTAGVVGSGTQYGMIATATNGTGIQVNGTIFGVYSTASDLAGTGIYARGTANGVSAMATNGAGVYAIGAARGIWTTASAGPGVEATGTTYGVKSTATAGQGVSSTGTTYGVYSTASAGPGVYASGTTFGVQARSSAGYALQGCYGSATNCASIGGSSYSGYFAGNVAIANSSATKDALTVTTNSSGIYSGINLTQSGTGYGIYVNSTSSGNAIEGHGASGYGIWGVSTGSIGVRGTSTSSYGVYANTTSGNAGLRACYGTNCSDISTADYAAEFSNNTTTSGDSYADRFVAEDLQYSYHPSYRDIRKDLNPEYHLYSATSTSTWSYSPTILDMVWDGNYMWGIEDGTSSDNYLLQMNTDGEIIEKLSFWSSAVTSIEYRDIVDAGDYIAVLSEYEEYGSSNDYCIVHFIHKKDYTYTSNAQEGSGCYGMVWIGEKVLYSMKDDTSGRATYWKVWPTPAFSQWTYPYIDGCDYPRDVAYAGLTDYTPDSGYDDDDVNVLLTTCYDITGTNDSLYVLYYDRELTYSADGVMFNLNQNWPDKVLYDGKYIWISYKSTSNGGGIRKYYLDHENQTLTEVKAIEGIGSTIYDIDYDGANIWASIYSASFEDNLLVIPAKSDTTTYHTYDDASYYLAFDGNNMWTSGYGNNLHLRYTSRGSYNLQNNTVQRGMIMFSEAGVPYCVYVDDSNSATPSVKVLAEGSGEYEYMCTGGY